MVSHLPAPLRPLRGGLAWRWDGARPWLRIYHAAPGRDATTRRTFGPLERFDPHTPPYLAPAEDPDGRAVIYLGNTLRTAAAEVFGAHRLALICPRYRVAALVTDSPITVQNLRASGAMLIGGLPAMSVADLPRPETQAWARAIYEDRPAGPNVAGVRYTSAYAGGISLALWDTAARLRVALVDGVVQDLPLAADVIFGRLLVAVVSLGIEVRRVESADCGRCSRVSR